MEDESVLAEIASLEQHYASTLLERIGQFNALDIPRGHQYYYFSGPVGFFHAINQAIEFLHDGRYTHCVVGAIDSLLDPLKLMQLWEEGQLKNADNPTGLMPGEACAFVLLTLPGVSEASSIALFPAYLAQEERAGIDKPSSGMGLKTAMDAALSAADDGPFAKGCLYLDLNGEPHRAYEWGLSSVMSEHSQHISQWRQHLPVEGFGDTGTAYGALSMVLAYRAFARGYASGHYALVLCADSQGGRAALRLSKAVA